MIWNENSSGVLKIRNCSLSKKELTFRLSGLLKHKCTLYNLKKSPSLKNGNNFVEICIGNEKYQCFVCVTNRFFREKNVCCWWGESENQFLQQSTPFLSSIAPNFSPVIANHPVYTKIKIKHIVCTGFSPNCLLKNRLLFIPNFNNTEKTCLYVQCFE